MGGRDLENNTSGNHASRSLEKETRSCEGIEEYVKDLLEDIQANVYKKALDYRNSRITSVDSYEEFKEKIEEGGFILAHWDGTTETEEKIKEETKATIRCIPFDSFVPVTRNRQVYGYRQAFCLPRVFSHVPINNTHPDYAD